MKKRRYQVGQRLYVDWWSGISSVIPLSGLNQGAEVIVHKVGSDASNWYEVKSELNVIHRVPESCLKPSSAVHDRHSGLARTENPDPWHMGAPVRLRSKLNGFPHGTLVHILKRGPAWEEYQVSEPVTGVTFWVAAQSLETIRVEQPQRLFSINDIAQMARSVAGFAKGDSVEIVDWRLDGGVLYRIQDLHVYSGPPRAAHWVRSEDLTSPERRSSPDMTYQTDLKMAAYSVPCTQPAEEATVTTLTLNRVKLIKSLETRRDEIAAGFDAKIAEIKALPTCEQAVAERLRKQAEALDNGQIETRNGWNAALSLTKKGKKELTSDQVDDLLSDRVCTDVRDKSRIKELELQRVNAVANFDNALRLLKLSDDKTVDATNADYNGLLTKAFS